MRGVRSALGLVLGGALLVGGMVGPPGLEVAAAGQAASSVSAVGPLSTKLTPVVRLSSTAKLVVDVDPNLSGRRYWRFKLQVRSKGKWRKVGVYRTQGAGETRSLRVKAATYRVKVYARPGYRSVTTKAYVFVPTAVPTPPDTTAPGPVTGLAMTGRSATSIALSWVNPTDADLAAVIVRRASGGTAPATAADGAGLPVAGAPTSAIDSGLAPTSTYSYAVFTRDAAGNTGPRAIITTSTAGAWPQENARVSVASDGSQANASSGTPAVSLDGQWVAYASSASNLVAGDTNGASDVFLFNRASGATTRVSVGAGGAQANSDSWGPAISGDGRWVTYASMASNLVVGDSNVSADVFLYDRSAAVTTRVSVGSGGVQAHGWSVAPSISADGRWICYDSAAANLVADANGSQDVFLHDRVAGTVQRVSVATGGAEGNGQSFDSVISADGAWLAYLSIATNLVPGDTNAARDVFVFERASGVTMRASVATGGVQANGGSLSPSVSADGRWIAFQSEASNLVVGDSNGQPDPFLFDTMNKVTIRAASGVAGAQPNGQAGNVGISGDGRWVVFDSAASNLVPGDGNGLSDVFVFDAASGAVVRVSLAPGGVDPDAASIASGMSADGRVIGYASMASNLVSGDTNAGADAFVTRMW